MTEAEAPIDLDEPGDPSSAPVPRRRRQRGYWVAGAVLLAAAVTVAVAGIGPTHAPPRPPSPPSTGPLGWIEAVVDGPARGGLADDPAFAADLPAQLTAMLQRTGNYPADLYGLDRSWHPDQEVQLLFADDIATQRIVLLALRVPMADLPTITIDKSQLDDQNLTGNRTKVLWFVGPRGATVSSLLSYFSGIPDDGVSAGSMPAEPFVLAQVSYTYDIGKVTWIGLAPHGCTVSTASTTEPDTYLDESTGSYIVRTGETSRPEFWRVTCGGTVHEQWPAPVSFHVVTPEERNRAMAGAAGLSPAEAAATNVQSAVDLGLTEIYSRASELTGPPRVVWAGVAQVDPGLEEATRPFAVVASAPAAPSGWFVAVWFCYLLDGYAAGLGSALIHTDTDPAAGTVITTPMQVQDSSWQFVLAPPAASGVRLQKSPGAVVRDTVLTSRAAVLTLPADPAELQVQAWDETGTPVAGPVPAIPPNPPSGRVSDWSGSPATAG